MHNKARDKQKFTVSVSVSVCELYARAWVGGLSQFNKKNNPKIH